jgi:hypothetical protein
MDANEIAVDREQRDRERMVLNFLAECIGKPREAAHGRGEFSGSAPP